MWVGMLPSTYKAILSTSPPKEKINSDCFPWFVDFNLLHAIVIAVLSLIIIIAPPRPLLSSCSLRFLDGHVVGSNILSLQ